MSEHAFVTLICGHCGAQIRVPQYCGNRFCTTCGTIRSKRLLRRVGSVTAKITPRGDYSFKFLTLTVPRKKNLKGSIDEVLKSFRRFRQRSYWKKNVRGGAYFIEFKHTPNGWNPHLHVVIESRYMPVKTIRRHWEQVSPGKIVDIRRIPVGSAIRYASKYCTKLDLPDALQVQASKALQNRRLFTFFGTWARIPVSTDLDVVKCKNCGVRCWCFNPYSSLSQWVEKNTSEFIAIPARSPTIPEPENRQKMMNLYPLVKP
jgi:hypothetical protein